VQALKPRYLRVMVDWARLQATPQPARLDAPADGCLRGIPPCATYRGLRDELRAIAAMQRARHGPLDVELVFEDVPDWAASPASGCERSDAAPRNRPISALGLAGYRVLIADVAALAERAGARVRFYSPWNEPNHPTFISPQRAVCDAASPTEAAGVYAQLVRAARTVLRGLPGRPQLVLGEMAGVTTPTPRGSSVQEMVQALPDDVACASRTWSQHAYAVLDPRPADGDPVAALEQALDARRCTAGAHIWVTETGVGGPRPGADRPTDPASLQTQCDAMAQLLARWADDPRVDAAFQYTFREDPAYPVGLADAGLTRLYPTYDLWRAYGAGARPASCG
jgi:hypothetical protein